jgi:hypothetical protein
MTDDIRSGQFHLRSGVATLICATLVVLCAQCQIISAQTKKTTQKLPSAEKVVEGYLKAIGGKKNVAGVRTTTHEWIVRLKDQSDGTARWFTKFPGSQRRELVLSGNQVIAATNTSSAWTEESGTARTLMGAEAANAKLRAVLDASRLVDYKKANVLARVISLEQAAAEPSIVVEFSHRSGARLEYWFSLKTRLLLKIVDETAKTTTRFEDYSLRGKIFESHRIQLTRADGSELVLELREAVHNIALADAIFDPPRADTSVDVTSLLRAVGRNQDQVEKRVNEYSFLQKETEREINGRGEVKKETIKVFEVFPIAHRRAVMKLISENGVVLSGERAAKEEKRVTEEFLKAEKDREKDQEKADRLKEERQRKASKGQENDDPGISQFLLACEFIAPRRERFRDRDAVVFDFRPRPGFKPGNRSESLISKLVGVVWIDPVDKQVMRLEARLAEGFKMGGGLLLSVRPGAAVVMEQTRMVEGVWLPSFAQLNLSVKVLLFGGGDINQTVEWSGYRHFAGQVRDYKLEAPKSEPDKKP